MLRRVRQPLRLSFQMIRDKIHEAKLQAQSAEDVRESELAAERLAAVQGSGGHADAGSPLHRYLHLREHRQHSSHTSRGTQDHQLRCPRSALFVPCSNPKALQKIRSLNHVDLFILDLEDSVAPDRKNEARAALVKEVQGGLLDGGKRAIVRINAWSGGSSRSPGAVGALDLDAVASIADKVEGIGIPKVSLEDGSKLFDAFPLHPDHVCWAFFETPQSILDANAILSQGLYHVACLGLNDLSCEMSFPPSSSTQGPRFQHYYAFGQLLTAARARGVAVVDGVFNDPTDTAGFRQEMVECRRWGFDGKTLIHPSQVQPCNEALTPTPAEREWATRVSAAILDARGGVATVDGRMVEELHARQAARWLRRAELAASRTDNASHSASTTPGDSALP